MLITCLLGATFAIPVSIYYSYIVIQWPSPLTLTINTLLNFHARARLTQL